MLNPGCRARSYKWARGAAAYTRDCVLATENASARMRRRARSNFRSIPLRARTSYIEHAREARACRLPMCGCSSVSPLCTPAHVGSLPHTNAYAHFASMRVFEHLRSSSVQATHTRRLILAPKATMLWVRAHATPAPSCTHVRKMPTQTYRCSHNSR